MAKQIYPLPKSTTGGSTNMVRYLCIGCTAWLFLLSGCTTTSKENTIPKEGPTIEHVYRSHMGATAGSGLRYGEDIPRRSTEDASMSSYTRTNLNQTENRFGRLPNPDLVMYVFPHLSGNGSRYPVPGYTTVFPMYDTIEYAMPGEIAPHEIRHQESSLSAEAKRTNEPVQSDVTVAKALAGQRGSE